MSAPRSRIMVALHGVFAALFLFGVGFLATSSDAQTQPRSRGHADRPHKSVDGGMRSDEGTAAEPPRRGSGDAGPSETVTRKAQDGGTKVRRFGELDIEGRLKNPQLVFFLRRVRAEFAAGDLGHRSFLHELYETKLDPNF